ncbi:MAG: hypothetical protein ABIH99_02795 [Candidatus Micrarchaeota archaeon]
MAETAIKPNAKLLSKNPITLLQTLSMANRFKHPLISSRALDNGIFYKKHFDTLNTDGVIKPQLAVRTGSLIVYERPNERFFRYLVHHDPMSKITFIIDVPKKLIGKANCAFVVEHKIINGEPTIYSASQELVNRLEIRLGVGKNAKFQVIENFPETSDAFPFEEVLGIPSNVKTRCKRRIWRSKLDYIGFVARGLNHLPEAGDARRFEENDAVLCLPVSIKLHALVSAKE